MFLSGWLPSLFLSSTSSSTHRGPCPTSWCCMLIDSNSSSFFTPSNATFEPGTGASVTLSLLLVERFAHRVSSHRLFCHPCIQVNGNFLAHENFVFTCWVFSPTIFKFFFFTVWRYHFVSFQLMIINSDKSYMGRI